MVLFYLYLGQLGCGIVFAFTFLRHELEKGLVVTKAQTFGPYKPEIVCRGLKREMEAVCLVVDCGQTASAEVPGGSFLARSAHHCLPP